MIPLLEHVSMHGPWQLLANHPQLAVDPLLEHVSMHSPWQLLEYHRQLAKQLAHRPRRHSQWAIGSPWFSAASHLDYDV
jgi:hypothetical protein